MRLMVGTPCNLGMVTSQYLLAFLQTHNSAMMHKQEIGTQLMKQFPGGYKNENPQHIRAMQEAMHQHTVDIALYTMVGESLLARGRNHIAAQALYEGFDKLLFIDADQGWSWDDFKKIVFSPHPFIAGCVPLKSYPRPSFQTSLNYLPYLDDEVHFGADGVRDLASTRKMAEAHGSPVVKVAFTGTGFLCISRKVLQALAEHSEEYLYPNPYTRQSMVHWSIFDGGPINETYLSEDWSVCEKVRKLGFDVMIDTSVLCSHTGPHTFLAG